MQNAKCFIPWFPRSIWEPGIARFSFFIFHFSFFISFCLPAAGAADPRRVVVPFDFVSKFDDGRYGRMVGEMIWKKLARDGRFIVPESMQEVRDFCAARNLAPSPETDQATMRKIVREDFDAQIGVWGSIERAPGTDEDIYDLTIKCVDFSDEKQPRAIYAEKVRAKTVGEVPHLYVKRMLDALKGGKPDGPPATDPIAEENWKKGPNLVAGDFQHGADGVPKGWADRAGQRREPLGGQVRWVDETDDSKNRVIRFVLEKQVAETTGVMYYSDFFQVEEGTKYRFQCRWRSDGPAVKVFIKCYDYLPKDGRRREVYRSQQNLDGPKNAWNTHAEEFTPRHTNYSPRWGRVMLYAYLKPGAVEFDDVIVKRLVPASPGERAKARRPSSESDVTLEEMESNRRRGVEDDKQK
ncbi:MAG: hypothetical protein JW959_03620 [Pirellulales bacterium]|nr:hypothetical protein [Pirellulales bacterium]